jgi:signal transduction histidine kinase
MSANQLLRIINDVLDYSKIEAQRLTFERQHFSLKQTLDDSIRTLSASAELKHIYLTCQPVTPLPEIVVGDRGRLLQILLNLLGNAVKFTDRGGVVMSVEATPFEELAQDGPSAAARIPDTVLAARRAFCAFEDPRMALHIKVSDTGVGIPSGKLDSIFNAFVQADNSDARRFGGSGLGLAISSQLAAGMNGKIWAESVLGVGSTFHVLLDLALPLDDVDDRIALSRVGDASSGALA